MKIIKQIKELFLGKRRTALNLCNEIIESDKKWEGEIVNVKMRDMIAKYKKEGLIKKNEKCSFPNDGELCVFSRHANYMMFTKENNGYVEITVTECPSLKVVWKEKELDWRIFESLRIILG